MTAAVTLRGPARYGPFLAMLAIALAIPFAVPGHNAMLGWWAPAFGCAVLMAGVWWLDARRPGNTWTGLTGALLTFPVVLLLEFADSDHATAFIPILLLPVIWCALHERTSRVLVALALAGLTLVVPIVLIGAPGYPMTAWYRAAVWSAVLPLVALAVHLIVGSNRLATSRLADSEQRYRAAFAEAPSAIAIIGGMGRERGRVLQANAPMHELLQCAEGQLVGRDMADFAHPEDVDRLTEQFRTARPGEVYSAEVRVVPDVGPQRWAAVSFALARSDAEGPPRFVCHLSDVTARRRTEESLRRALEKEGVESDQLREAAQASTDLVAAVSHDVRTPLATIGAYVQLLEAGDAGALNDDQCDMLRVIAQNVRRAYQITDDLLALGQVGHTASTTQREIVPIGELVAQVVRAIEPNARERGQRLTFVSELGDAHVSGFAGQLDRMLGNLLTNAVKFTPEGGTITVRGFRGRTGEISVSVTDTGAGIPEEEQEMIFERFYRTDDTRRAHLPGTGLGLAIVQEIVAVHNGTIAVRSTPGNGATFTVTLPDVKGAMSPSSWAS